MLHVLCQTSDKKKARLLPGLFFAPDFKVIRGVKGSGVEKQGCDIANAGFLRSASK